MPKSKSKPAAPMTFDLPVALLAKLAQAQKRHQLASASAVVRLALSEFDLAKFRPAREPHRQISVRLPAKLRAALRQTARRQDASIGEIIRAALAALPAPKRK